MIKIKLWGISKRLSIAALIAMAVTTVSAQKVKISGTVVDDNHEPITGATVEEQGKANGIATDINGRFTLSVDRKSKLRISYIGFEPQTVDSRDGINIVMKESSNMLSEVVAIGYGSVRRKDVTTAVSTVSTKDLDSRPIVSAEMGIQGKAAGIQVAQANGQPGVSPTIRVRGTTSFNASNAPLYVVDGVPMTDIGFLSADDISDMQILKDASSAAIYGSRAANGVIMITTKQGKAGVAKISLNAHYSFNTVRDNQDPLNASQYWDLMEEINGPQQISNWFRKDRTDWKDQVYQTGNVQDYQLAVTNGNDKLRYYISGGYTGENGVIKDSNFKRYNIKATIDNDIKSWLNIGANIAYSDYTWKGTGIISGTGANRGGVVPSIIATPTYAPVWDEDNPNQYYNNFLGARNISNPLENIARTKNNKSAHNRLIATGKATVTFAPFLNFKTQYTFDRAQGIITNFLDPISTQNGRDEMGTAYDERNISSVMVWDNVLNYKEKFGLHNIDAMVGSSWTGSKWSRNYINASHFADDKFQTINAANKIAWDGTSSAASEWAIMSYFARLAYNFNDTYLLTVNMRSDGSSKLHPNHRWGYFPSFSAAWRISQEKFMQNIRWINDLKLRGGWGKTGNQSGLGDYAYLAQYSAKRFEWFGENGNPNAVVSWVKNSLESPELTWEKTASTNIGLDFTVLNNRLTFNVDWYYKKTTDMLMTVTLPKGQPASTLRTNGGSMVNKGWEFTVNSHNLTGRFSWDTDFNISFNKNKLESLRLTQVYSDGNIDTGTLQGYVVRNTPGMPLGSFYGFVAEGVDPETGDMIYKDLNKNGSVNAADRTYIGDPNPDFTFGMTNTFSWKGLSLSVLLQGSYGNDIYNVSRMVSEGMQNSLNQTTNVLRRWRVPGQITDVPRAKFNQKISSYYVEDGSYLRVKNVSLSYDVPKKYIKHIGLTRLQPYFTATNLITFTDYSGMDPEVNQWGDNGSVQGIDWGVYPLSRSFTFGLKVEF